MTKASPTAKDEMCACEAGEIMKENGLCSANGKRIKSFSCAPEHVRISMALDSTMGWIQKETVPCGVCMG